MSKQNEKIIIGTAEALEKVKRRNPMEKPWATRETVVAVGRSLVGEFFGASGETEPMTKIEGVRDNQRISVVLSSDEVLQLRKAALVRRKRGQVLKVGDGTPVRKLMALSDEGTKLKKEVIKPTSKLMARNERELDVLGKIFRDGVPVEVK